jgi:signal transduction histidine kinase
VLSEAELQRAAKRRTFFERDRVQGVEGPVRLLAAPVTAEGAELIVVVGASLDDRDEALSSLVALFLIGGPAALALASVAGYWVAAKAFRPVEAMRRQAASISAREPDERLPVPAADDELARLSRTLNEMLDRLEAALARERRFVNDASHELRTPLALHKTELEVALRYAKDERELRAAMTSAVEEIDRLIQLAEDLLVVASSQEGKLALKVERVAVDDLFSAVSERFRARAEAGARPISPARTGGLAVDGDRLRLEQALTGMVDNALRHGEGEVRLWAIARDGAVELHVGDRGPGLPEGFIARAFERFSRADEARGRGGTGLGLAIVDTIAHAHGGRARAANDGAGGADVWIEIPAHGS